MEKSPDAFRTISEVADWLGVPTHVLRFWESRFSQVKPVKRAGGRRYYRPSDMQLLGGIKRLLHDDGMTIRGVQKLLREEGVRHVAGFSQPLDTDGPMRDVTPEEDVAQSPMAVDVEPEPLDNVVPLAPAPEPVAAEDVSRAVEEPPASLDEEIAAEAPEVEPSPELSFLRRAEPETPETEEAEATAAPIETTAQADLFTSRRSAATAPPPPEPAPIAIPATPDVPGTDPEDDDPAFPARPGLAARLRGVPASRLKADPALVAHAVSELRAIRARL